MKWRNNKLAWILMALVVMLQAVVPTMTLAEVSVRCVGSPTSSAPCMKAVIPSQGMTATQIKCADMSCCKNMSHLMRTCSMAMAADNPSASATVVSAPKCLISITPFSSSQPASVNSHRWLLNASPALAPPSAVQVTLTVPPAVVGVRPHSISILPSVPTHSHGLRAPPIA